LDDDKTCGHGSWGGYGMMPGHMPGMGMDMGGMGMKMGMMSGMKCPVCGMHCLKPTKEEMVEMLEKKKKRLQAFMAHLDKEIEMLKSGKEEW
jgi:hypothetical protein